MRSRPACWRPSCRREGQGRRGAGRLAWVADKPSRRVPDVARLRLAGLLLDAKKYDEALKQLDGVDGAEFEALVADRRGDVLLAQGKKAEARRPPT